MTNTVNFLTNEFFNQAKDDHEIVTAKEKQISALRDELNPEVNKISRITCLAVVVKQLGLDVEKFKGRKALAGEFKKNIESLGIKPALAKILCENAIKFAKHEAFQEEVRHAMHEGLGWYNQIIASVLDAEGITTQSQLIAFLNPKEEVADEVQVALLTLKLAGVKKSNIEIKKNKVTVKFESEPESDERREEIKAIKKAQKIAHNAYKLLDLENCRPSK